MVMRDMYRWSLLLLAGVLVFCKVHFRCTYVDMMYRRCHQRRGAGDTRYLEGASVVRYM